LDGLVFLVGAEREIATRPLNESAAAAGDPSIRYKIPDCDGARIGSPPIRRLGCRRLENAHMATIYVATAVSTGTGRDGHVETIDGMVSLDLAYPKEIGGSGGGSNPEQLVAMGYAACFSSALGVVARRRKIALSAVEVTCNVSLDKSDDDYSLSFEIVARLPGVAADEADALVAEAHTVCPYSKAFTHGAPTHARAGT
jgi:lipoyl-dependent peroxiredoxin